MDFSDWLSNYEKVTEGVMRPGAKRGLYPPGYGGIGLYPPCDWTPGAADAITYMDKKDLKFKFLYSFLPPKKVRGAIIIGDLAGDKA